MFRSLDYDFTCPQCLEPNDGSQIVAGLRREEAQTNILTRIGLVCSHCGEPLLADAEVHFSKNNVAHVWNRSSRWFTGPFDENPCPEPESGCRVSPPKMWAALYYLLR